MGMFEQIQKMQADMQAAQDALANEVDRGDASAAAS